MWYPKATSNEKWVHMKTQPEPNLESSPRDREINEKPDHRKSEIEMSGENSSPSSSEQPSRPRKGKKRIDRVHESVETLWETVWEAQQYYLDFFHVLHDRCERLERVVGHQHDEIQRLKASLPPPRFRRRS